MQTSSLPSSNTETLIHHTRCRGYNISTASSVHSLPSPATTTTEANHPHCRYVSALPLQSAQRSKSCQHSNILLLKFATIDIQTHSRRALCTAQHISTTSASALFNWPVDCRRDPLVELVEFTESSLERFTSGCAVALMHRKYLNYTCAVVAMLTRCCC